VLQVRRFEHYEVILDETGRPIELGRGMHGIPVLKPVVDDLLDISCKTGIPFSATPSAA
jgi:hypothetical protein